MVLHEKRRRSWSSRRDESRRGDRNRSRQRDRSCRRDRSRLSSSSSSTRTSGSRASTTPEEERAKHYPMFDASYASRSTNWSQVVPSRPVSSQPFLVVGTAGDTQHLVLYGRYLFLRQLGKGTFAKVALVRDLLSDTAAPKLLALKVFRGERNYDEAFEDEQRILTQLKILGSGTEARRGDAPVGTSSQLQALLRYHEVAEGLCRRDAREEYWSLVGSQHCGVAIAAYEHPVHCVTVNPVFGMSLLELMEARAKAYAPSRLRGHLTDRRRLKPKGGSLPLSFVRAVGYQLLCVAQFLRSRRVVHTDLKPENILLTDQRLLRGGITGPLPVTNSVHVIDFGSARCTDDFSATAASRRDSVQGNRRGQHDDAQRHDRVSYSVIQTRHYRAPEVIFGSGWSYPAEIWSIALILLELHTGECVFMTHSDDEHLAMMERLLGKPLKRYEEIYAGGSRLSAYVSSRTGELRWRSSCPFDELRYVEDVTPLAALEKRDDDDDMYHFCDVVKRMLDWDPRRRLTPAEALSHSFFAEATIGS